MPRSISTDLLILAAILLPDLATAAVSLTQFQAIVGFPAACTTAYQTPVTQCTASDFSNGAPCSANCISGLEQLTTTINTACQGSKANPQSLIGLFFQNKGVESLCPNSVNGGATSTTQRGGSTTLTQLTVGLSSVTRTTTQATSATSTAQTTASSISDDGSDSSAAAQSTLQITGGASAQSTSVSRNTEGFTTTVFNQGVASVITSKAEQTASNNPEAFGGGGSPFEVGPNDSSAIRASDMTAMRLAATLATVFLLALGLS